jgi:Skp family chaperone for outer membrane proteins
MKSPLTRVLTAAVVLVGVLVLTNALAQPAAAPAAPPAARVGTCDIVELFTNYQRAKDLTSQLNERRQAITVERDKRTKAINTLQAELENYKKASPKYEQTVDEIQRLGIEAKAYLEYQDALALREHRNLTKEMYTEIKAVIAKVAKQRGLNIILQREPDTLDTDSPSEMLRQIYTRKVLFTEDGLDITDVVLAALNQAYRVKAPAGATTRP